MTLMRCLVPLFTAALLAADSANRKVGEGGGNERLDPLQRKDCERRLGSVRDAAGRLAQTQHHQYAQHQ